MIQSADIELAGRSAALIHQPGPQNGKMMRGTQVWDEFL